MIDNTENAAPPPARRGAGGIISEAALVALVGVVFALLANSVAPHGLRFRRNYFPGDSTSTNTPPAMAGSNGSNAAPDSTNTAQNPLEAKLRAEGLHLLDLAQAGQLFRDPRKQENLILFIDARGEDDFARGHIPGAYEFYPYHPEKYLAEILPACQIAQQIVVYCTGGECEDSHSAALYLRDDAQVAADKLYVFGGGMTEWEAAKMPLESGPRNSGEIHTPPP
jgi:rhodanese-related sulfurtransferase